MRPERKPWFAPKRYGYGAGLPIAWQGWAVLVVYFLILMGASFVLPYVFPNPAVSLPVIGAVVLLSTLVVMVICARTTKGGWHWRWDKDN